MFRKLLIVFASGMLLALVAFSGAWLAGGKEFRSDFARNGGWHWDIDHDGADHGPRKARAFALVPGTQLTIEVPVDLDFERGDTPSMTVEGHAADVDRLVWKDGHLSMPDGTNIRHGFRVRIVSPQIAGLDIAAPADVNIKDMQQDAFRFGSNGPVNLEASGKVRSLTVEGQGAGDLDFGHLEAQDAKVNLQGVGDIAIAATGNVDVSVQGIGSVSLKKKPAHLVTNVQGLGSIDHDY